MPPRLVSTAAAHLQPWALGLRRGPGIVPIERVPHPVDKTGADLDVHTMATGAAGIDLAQQFFELRRAWRAPMRAQQPMAQHVALARARELLKRRDARRCAHTRKILLGQLDQQCLRLGRMRGAAGEGATKLGKDLLQRRQQRAADAVAGIARVTVARVFDPAHALATQPATDFAARKLKKGPVIVQAIAPRPVRHGGQTRQTGPTRERQQDGLDLVIRMVAEGDVVNASVPRQCRKRGIARTPGRVFRALAANVRRIHMPNNQRHRQIGAHRAAVGFEAIRRRLQAVMHMKGMHPLWPAPRASQQQRGGIRAATEAHGKRQVGFEGGNRVFDKVHGASP